MNFLVDSDVLIDTVGGYSASRALFKSLIPGEISISTITYMETLDGLISKPNAMVATLDALLDDIFIIPVDQAIAERCAWLRLTLRRQGKNPRRRALDLLIAATAIERNLVLVTRNTKHFSDIPGLALYAEPSS